MDASEKNNSSQIDEGKILLEAYHDALQRGGAQEVEVAAMRFFDYACKKTNQEPSLDLLFKQNADDNAGTGEWQKAEYAYRQALEFAEVQGIPGLVYKAQADFSDFFSFCGQDDRALEAAQAATEAARLSGMTMLLGMALEIQADCWLTLENAAEAFQTADEMVQILPGEQMYDLLRARAFVLRASCYVRMQDDIRAQQDLETAWPILAPMSDAIMSAGIQSGLANWWEVTAKLKFLHADFDEAVTAWREAVVYRKNVSQAPQLEGPYKYASLARSLRHLGQALLAVEDVHGAEQAFRESQTIMSTIQKP